MLITLTPLGTALSLIHVKPKGIFKNVTFLKVLREVLIRPRVFGNLGFVRFRPAWLRLCGQLIV